MAEVQTTKQSGELTQHFIEFVMMQAQNAALFLGQIPNPQTGQAEVNLDVARMFIDQLGMIQEKTRGNLTTEESTVLRNALSSLQMAFVEASQSWGSKRSVCAGTGGNPRIFSGRFDGEDASDADSSSAPPPEESKKKFSKSYGS